MGYLFVSLQSFTTTLLTIVATTLCRRIMRQVDAGQVHSLPRPPRVMQTLHFLGTLPGAPSTEPAAFMNQLMTRGPTATTSPATSAPAATASSFPTTTSTPTNSLTLWATSLFKLQNYPGTMDDHQRLSKIGQ